MIDVEMNRIQDWLETVAGYYEALYHDLKTPMAILFNHVQNMEKMDNLPEDVSENLGEIKRSCFRIAKLVRDANDRARLKQGQLTPHYVMVDAVCVLKKICHTAHTLMSAKDIHIIFNSTMSEIPMAMDRQMWERIILNLLANSKDFSYPGGEIHCNVSVEGDTLVVSIRDFGKGVPQELVSDIFSRYTGETKRGLRSGLGLYIVKELVMLMEGDVTLSRAEPGTEVVIRAPIFQTEEKQMTMTVDDFFSDNMVQMELSNI